MSARSLNVVVLMGGISAEHPISLRSAATVVPALEAAGHRVHSVAITRDGIWLLGDHRPLLERAGETLVEVDPNRGTPVTVARTAAGARLVALDGTTAAPADFDIDVVFPILHGPGGEDGAIQGMLEAAGVAAVGAGCRASALAMDKLAMKALCAGAAVPQVDFIAAGGDTPAQVAARLDATFGLPCFVKPANLGSSVGISRVSDDAELATALAEARRWDRRVIVERAVDAREIEVALLGGQRPDISPPGEIVTSSGFYDFTAKYVANDAELVVPADLGAAQLDEISAIALEVWKLIGCYGMARADFFVERVGGAVLFNEFNTIPGFTEISMFPRLWREAGLSTSELVDRLLRIAVGDAAGQPGGLVKHP